ncbi:hypothetical protein [Streptomyces capitiformicae]|uniref:hypothetical protein n=1 Tax=Streptomyces capitiformicae TaxID=2014920 RepID=UPI0016719C97|nr:hypothetical protein [Streptomyces capitiformicae]
MWRPLTWRAGRADVDPTRLAIGGASAGAGLTDSRPPMDGRRFRTVHHPYRAAAGWHTTHSPKPGAKDLGTCGG